MIIKEKKCSGGISPICSGVIFFRFNYNNSLYPKLYLYMWNNNSNNKNSHNFQHSLMKCSLEKGAVCFVTVIMGGFLENILIFLL